MTGSAVFLLLAAGTGIEWIDVVVLGVFALGLVLILLVPFAIDVINTHREYRDLVKTDPAAAANIKELRGVQGVARATMAFGVIAVIGFALVYILVERPFSDNKTVVNTIVVALTTTLASITAFYFGTRLASQAHQDAAKAVAAGAGMTRQNPGPPSRLTVTIAAPTDGAVFAQNSPVVASYTCTPTTGAQITTCNGTVPNGSPLDTSQTGTFIFTVTATDSAGQSAQQSSSYTVQ